MVVGYARVSRVEQSLDLQMDALKKAGCDDGYIFSDQVSGLRNEKGRPGLDAALHCLRKGDTFIVWKLDRLGRSVSDLVRIVKSLAEKGIEFRSVIDQVDTTTPAGRLMFHVFAMIAEFERDLIVERTKAGLAAAHARGIKSGRKPKLSKKQRALLRSIHASDEKPAVRVTCEQFGIDRRTYYRVVNEGGE